jgi:hypothetical protein
LSDPRPGRPRRRRRGRGRGGAENPSPPAPAAPPRRSEPRKPGGGRRPSTQRRPERRERGIEVTDQRVFELLEGAGADLAREHSVEAYLYFPSEAAARRVAGQLAEAGYETYAEPSPPTRWLVEAVRPLVPSREAIAALGDSMRAAARGAGGEYDGWWAFELPEEEEPPVSPGEPAPAASEEL